MWMFKYMACLFRGHVWIGSRSRYCLRCGSLEDSSQELHPHQATSAARVGAAAESSRFMVKKAHRTERGFYFVIRDS